MSTDYVPNSEFLDEEEKELAHLDPSTAKPEKEKLAAVETFRKALRTGSSKVISLRIDTMALERLKQQAQTEGLPYQTMIQSVLTRYVNGSLVDIKAVKEVVKALSI